MSVKEKYFYIGPTVGIMISTLAAWVAIHILYS